MKYTKYIRNIMHKIYIGLYFRSGNYVVETYEHFNLPNIMNWLEQQKEYKAFPDNANLKTIM